MAHAQPVFPPLGVPAAVLPAVTNLLQQAHTDALDTSHDLQETVDRTWMLSSCVACSWCSRM
jgi:hypothetical protein